MITRIVRMNFVPEKVETFLEHFETVHRKIRSFPGCSHLDLYRDADNPSVFYTYSIWENLEALEAYRVSELFKTTWAAVKIHFAEKPQAFSLQLEQQFSENK